MCSLTNAINMYKEDKKEYTIVQVLEKGNIPFIIKGRIQYFKTFEEANIDRIYFQSECTNPLKVIKI